MTTDELRAAAEELTRLHQRPRSFVWTPGSPGAFPGLSEATERRISNPGLFMRPSAPRPKWAVLCGRIRVFRSVGSITCLVNIW